MAFTYKGYRLYFRWSRERELVFFFSKNPPDWGLPCELPPGYIIRENDAGIPFLIKENARCPKCGSYDIEVLFPSAPGFQKRGRIRMVCRKCGFTFPGHSYGSIFHEW